MPSVNEITAEQLSRLIGLPGSPRLIDARSKAHVERDPRLLPAARNLDASDVQSWGRSYAGKRVVVYCHDGGGLSVGAAAWLRDEGVHAETLEGGFDAWCSSNRPLLRPSHIPARDDHGSTVWVTRARPKIIRIACPWLIRRFIDPDARFLYVAAPHVAAVADRFKATPFDTGHGIWNDQDEQSTFDVMLKKFELRTEPLLRLAEIVRGADTGRLDLASQSSGLLAASLGFSRMHRDDLGQLDAVMPLYDAFYRWCRDAFDETHG